MYVGYAINFKKRWETHKRELRNKKHCNIHLQRAWDEYKENSFLFEILVECEEEYLCSEENYWCNLLRVHNDKYGYNIQPTNPNGNPKQSEISKEKIRLANLKPVIILDKDSKYVEELNSRQEAHEKYKIGKTTIDRAIKRKSLTDLGFFFIEKSEYREDVQYYWDSEHNKKGKDSIRLPVKVTNIITGEIIIYNSCINATKLLGLKYPQVIQHGAKKGNIVKGKYKINYL